MSDNGTSDAAIERPLDRPRPRPRPYPTRPEPDTVAQSPDAASAQPVASESRPTEPKQRWARPGVALLVAAALVVAFVAANIWLFVQRSDSHGAAAVDSWYPINGARPAAVTSARQRIPAMLSYKYTDIANYVASAPTNATGQFKKDFTQLITRVIAPAAAKQKIVTTAQVKSAGVIDAHSDSVTVLVMLDQTTTSKATKGARVDGSRVRVVMTLDGGKWLVSSLTPI